MALATESSERQPVFDFDFIAGPAILDDVHDAYWKLKEQAPAVFWTPHNGGHWVVTTARMAVEVLRQPERFSNRMLSIPATPGQPRLIPESLDPPEHRRYRDMLHPYFSDKAIAPLAPRIQMWADRIIDSVAAQGECEFVDEVGSRFPLSVFMELFGFPLDQLEHYRTLVLDLFKPTSTVQRRMEVAQEVTGILAGLIAQRRAEPREDLMSSLVRLDFEGRKLNDEELISIGFLMFAAGLDTVVNALAFGMRRLGQDDALQSRLISDPDSVPAMVEELMRRFTFVATPRYVAQDTELSGARLREGDMVLVPLAVIGWDDHANRCPAEVQVDRPNCRHAAFGSGIHTCLGNKLARLEMTIFYRTWARRIGRFQVENNSALRCRGGTVQALEELPLKWKKGG